MGLVMHDATIQTELAGAYATITANANNPTETIAPFRGKPMGIGRFMSKVGVLAPPVAAGVVVNLSPLVWRPGRHWPNRAVGKAFLAQIGGRRG